MTVTGFIVAGFAIGMRVFLREYWAAGWPFTPA